jgi:hypothetical protein
MQGSEDYHVLIEKKFTFRFDEREIVYWQGVSNFSIPAQGLNFRENQRKGLKQKIVADAA